MFSSMNDTDEKKQVRDFSTKNIWNFSLNWWGYEGNGSPSGSMGKNLAAVQEG